MYKIKSIEFEDSHITGAIELREREDKIQSLLDSLDNNSVIYGITENPAEFIADLLSTIFDEIHCATNDDDAQDTLDKLNECLERYRR